MDQAKRLKALSIELGSPWENGYVEVLRHAVGDEGIGREMAQGVQPASASQRLGLSAAGARGPTPQVAQALDLIPWRELQMVPGLT